MSSGPPGRLRVKVSTTVASDNDDQVTQLIQKFNFDDLLHVLYGKKQGNTVDLLQLQKERKKERSKTYCVVCHVDRPPNGCPFHEPSSTHTADQDDSLSYAIKSFPAEVQLCTSSVPGAIFGVCAKRVIPEGTWIGPYEGRRVSPEELSVSRDNPYVWEIYKDGQPSYYIDGSDESASSWMRFIRCARHKEEQNLYAFQYLGNIFYRSFKEIPRGTEMLVWYDEKYPQHLGIPTGLQEIEFISSSDIEKNSNGDKTSNTVVKSEGDLRHHVDKEKVKEIETNRPQKDYHTRLVVQPAESHQRVMATSSPHRLRHFSYPNTTRISRAPHSLSPSPGYLTHELSSLSSPGIPHATVAATHYTRPHLPIVPPLQSTTPPSIYGLGYRHPLPVNISAGIPVSMSGRGQLGITGTQLPRVHKEVMEEAGIPVSMSGRGQLGITGTQLPRVHKEVMEEAGIPVSMSGRGQLGITGTQLPRVHQEVMEEAGIPVSMSGRGQLGITGTQLPIVHQEVLEQSGIPVSMSGRGQLGITGTQLPIVHQEVLEQSGIPVSMSGRGHLGITGTQLPIVHQEVLEQSGIPVSMSGRGHLGITGTQLPRVHQEVLEQSGIPVSMSGRGQLGITGTQLPRVHQEVMEEGPVIISSNSVVYSDRHHRTTPSTSPVDNINTLDRDGSLQQKRVFYPSTTANLNVTDEVGQHNIVTLKRKATESTTIDPETRQYPPLIKRKSPITNIIEDSSLESEKGWSTRPRTPKERFTDDQGSERTRNTKSHRSHFVKEEHVSKSSRVTSAWTSDESQLQDDAAGESSDSNSTSSTKNEPTGIDEISMWRCRQCQKTFTQRVMLQVHVCPQQPLKPYRCGQCELSFATATELRSHVETHASEKPFKCGFCSRSFAGATTLNNHIRTHMGKRPFSCEHCGKSFAQAGQLARHQRTPGECETRTTKS